MQTKDRARRLYRVCQNLELDWVKSIELWQGVFSIEELNELWDLCCNDLYIEYDDEVYEAIQRYKREAI